MSRRGKWLAAVLPLVCALAMLCAGFAVAVDEQGAVLLAWKATLRLRAGDALADWKPSDASPCRWTGVTCDARGGVTELRLESVQLSRGAVPANLTAMGATLAQLVLTDTNLTGPIPSELGKLPVLTNLNLSNNALTGPIPPELGELPVLAHLDLNDNALTGLIPPGLFRPGSKLETLYLNYNNLEGAIPDAIGNLTSLREFIFYRNQLAGKIPAAIGRMVSLEVLGGSGNKYLQGAIPMEIVNCSRLTEIHFGMTSITGPLPASLGGLKNLTTLDIHSALLSGPIPPELGQCISLEVIILYNNSLSGSIPAELGELKNLDSLYLGNNRLVGVIPPELGSCTKLSNVVLDFNWLTGHIPASFGNLSSLLRLDLYSNNLTGMVPPQLGQCTRLEVLTLSNNKLTGPIPLSLFQLPLLSLLQVDNNHLSGELPPEIGNCTSLLQFSAGGNRIAGAIPAEISRLGNLRFLDLSSNLLSGTLPTQISGCRNLDTVDLHDNAIAGELPSGLFQNFLLLYYLNLSYNNINGSLPSEIGIPKLLKKLILSGNRLSGRIPPEIGSCSQLELIDISGNSLSGKIPGSISKIQGLQITLNLSRNNFSGTLPAEFAKLVELRVLDVSHNQLSGDLQPLSALQNLVALNVSFNGFSGRLPETPFFKKFPRSDFEGNPALCLSQCTGDGKRGRTAIAVVLCTLAVLLVATTLALFWWRRRGRDKNGEMSPPWEVTLYQTLEISIADVARSLTPANVIGNGWSGPVYRANLSSSSVTIAVKKFQSCDEASIEAFFCEIDVLPLLRHRNIVRLLGWAANRSTRLLFYDYLPNGTLGGLLHGSGAVVEWEVRLMIAVSVAEGLVYLHHDCVPGIIHRDIKAENILLGDRYEACLADFGLARFVADDEGTNRHPSPPQFAGSYGYIAPECVANITTKSDVYSFGVVLLEIITGRRPLDSAFGEGQSVVEWARDHLCQRRHPVEIIDARLRGQQDSQVQETLQALRIALLCVNSRPHDRPTMKDVVALLRGISLDEGLNS